ncbi:MAG TPA: class I SAM-dependent methyltransferase [bacterium]|jgi:2-polyprenyl-6-hydroxyphenyl methylase/3-demethylubiquinone-9 3-methyltransferase
MKSTSGYYSQKLSGLRLKRCYDIAPPRVRQYLDAEIEFLLSKVHPLDCVLELGCGYGRALKKLGRHTRLAVGIDISSESLDLGTEFLGKSPKCRLLQMDAIRMAFPVKAFDLTVCIQNGISAFHVDKLTLLRESLRVTGPGGRVLFSSYAEEFWPDRLNWFRLQAAQGLVGEIDEAATGNGVIVCKDGFTATTISAVEFQGLCSSLGCQSILHTVDASSLFCEISK